KGAGVVEKHVCEGSIDHGGIALQVERSGVAEGGAAEGLIRPVPSQVLLPALTKWPASRRLRASPVMCMGIVQVITSLPSPPCIVPASQRKVPAPPVPAAMVPLPSNPPAKLVNSS